jgi:hypothetical protein
MKKVLLIATHFAPETHAAMFRVHKLAKYLKDYGWEPVVLTVDTNYNFIEDDALIEDLKGIKIYRSRYIEPTFRGLKMALGAKDTTYKNIKDTISTSNKELPKQTVAQLPKRFVLNPQKVLNFVNNHIIQAPDHFWTWKNSAIQLGSKIIKEENISLIFTTSPQYTQTTVAVALKKKFNLPWVADFRDPMTYTARNSGNEKIFYKQKKIEDKAIDFADQITLASEAFRLIYHDKYNGRYDKKMNVIPTGLDEDLLDDSLNIKLSNDPYIVYSGEYLPQYGEQFFSYLEEYYRAYPTSNLKCVFVGNTAINQPKIQPYLIKYQLTTKATFIDHLQQKELYSGLKNAVAGVLIPGTGTHWWTLFAKLVDYVALSTPVLAIVPNPSVARAILDQSTLGIYIDQANKRRLQDLNDLVTTKKTSVVDENFREIFTAKQQVKSFSQIFDSLYAHK